MGERGLCYVAQSIFQPSQKNPHAIYAVKREVLLTSLLEFSWIKLNNSLINKVHLNHLLAPPEVYSLYCKAENIGHCFGHRHWGQRLERWPNTEACLAGWRSVTQPGEICVVMDAPCRLPWRTILLVLHCKKGYRFPFPTGMSLTKLSPAGNN
jgi:hypothetical protein